MNRRQYRDDSSGQMHLDSQRIFLMFLILPYPISRQEIINNTELIASIFNSIVSQKAGIYCNYFQESWKTSALLTRCVCPDALAELDKEVGLSFVTNFRFCRPVELGGRPDKFNCTPN